MPRKVANIFSGNSFLVFPSDLGLEQAGQCHEYIGAMSLQWPGNSHPQYACERLAWTCLCISAFCSSSLSIVWYANEMTWLGRPSKADHDRGKKFFMSITTCQTLHLQKERVTCYLCNLNAMRSAANSRRYPMVKDVTPALTQMQAQLLIWKQAAGTWRYSIADELTVSSSIVVL